MISFPTRAQAEAAGWRSVNRTRDRDVSDIGSFGYEYESPEGHRTTTVSLTEAKNKLGRPGCFAPMFPPHYEDVKA